MDHFSKYIWLYPLHHEFDVFIVFIKFKTMVEIFFKTPIVSIYFNGGEEYEKLISLCQSQGIQHLKTALHTPEHNGSAERYHRYVVKIGLTLLHKASLPYFY